jgi:hypothetical protein
MRAPTRKRSIYDEEEYEIVALLSSKYLEKSDDNDWNYISNHLMVNVLCI